eukprot:15337971-Ditylum_brightwellii.AAC.1
MARQKNKPTRKRATKRVKWGKWFHSDEKSKDEGTVEIDENEVYKPVNPNISESKRQVYNLQK